jgi:hypothetical protein
MSFSARLLLTSLVTLAVPGAGFVLELPAVRSVGER